MNNKQVRRLKRIAASLPEIPHFHRTKVKGSVLIEQGITADKEGKPIDAKKDYLGPKPSVVNHLSALKSIFQQEGEAGVAAYCGIMVRKRAELDKALAKAAATTDEKPFELESEFV